MVPRIVAPALELSSGEVRDAVAEGRTIDEMVPPAVAHYIAEHGLYKRP